jgi:predicted GIY-YIG superfamily endonuclease
MSFYAYILECADGSFYTGHTDDLEARLTSHQDGTFKGYTSRPKKRPVKLVFHADFPTRVEAFAAERQIKGWSRAKKALVRGDWAEIEGLSRE